MVSVFKIIILNSRKSSNFGGSRWRFWLSSRFAIYHLDVRTSDDSEQENASSCRIKQTIVHYQENEDWLKYRENSCVNFSLFYRTKNHSLPLFLTALKVFTSGVRTNVPTHVCYIFLSQFLSFLQKRSQIEVEVYYNCEIFMWLFWIIYLTN